MKELHLVESLTEAKTNQLKEILQRLQDDLEVYKDEDMFDFEMELPEKYRDKVSDIMRDAEGVRDYSIQEVKEFTDSNGKPYVYVYMYVYPGIDESLDEDESLSEFDEGFVGVKGPVKTKYDDKFNLSNKQEKIAADIIGACWAIDPYADMYEFTEYTPEMEEFFEGEEPLLDELVKYYVMQGKEKEFLRNIFDIDGQIEEVESWEDPEEESTTEFLKSVRDKYLGGEEDTVSHESLDEAKNDTLNPAIWDSNGEMIPEVKDKLQYIADKFIEKLVEDDIPLEVDDIEVVGSNANYNYGPQSDIDLHIIADLSQFKGREKELAEKIYQAKKSIFNDKYDPMIRGFEVEIYVEPAEDKNMNEIPDEVEEEKSLEEAIKPLENYSSYKLAKLLTDKYYDLVFAKDDKQPFKDWFDRNFGETNRKRAAKIISNFTTDGEKRVNRSDLFYVRKYVDRVADLLDESLDENRSSSVKSFVDDTILSKIRSYEMYRLPDGVSAAYVDSGRRVDSIGTSSGEEPYDIIKASIAYVTDGEEEYVDKMYKVYDNGDIKEMSMGDNSYKNESLNESRKAPLKALLGMQKDDAVSALKNRFGGTHLIKYNASGNRIDAGEYGYYNGEGTAASYGGITCWLDDDGVVSVVETYDKEWIRKNESLNEAVDIGDCIEITPEKGLEIFDTREPRGKFWYKENQIFIAVDNTEGDAWTEDFKTLEDAINWLNRTDYEESPDPGSSFELDEDTVKQNCKWVNKGDEGTHGKFKTKKEADAQRKAMFANGYKESFGENNSKLNDYFDINEDIDANVERVRAILLDNGDHYDVYEKDGKIAVEIDWGDWKHDHIYLDNLLSNYGLALVDEEITDEDGSDTYSSIHYFEDPDDYQVDETLELHIPFDDSEFEEPLEESDHRSSKDIAWDEFLKEKGYDSQEAYDNYLDSLDDDEFDKYTFRLRDEFKDYYIDWLEKEFKYDLDSKYPDEEDIPSFWEWIEQQGMNPDDVEDNPDLEDYYQQQYDITFNLKSPEDYRY